MNTRRFLVAVTAVVMAIALTGIATCAPARSATWSVVFDGEGEFTHSATLPRSMCDTPSTATASSTFQFDFGWRPVVFGSHPSVGSPTGELKGQATQSLNDGDTSVGACKQTTCNKQVSFSADTGDQGDPMTVLRIAPDGNEYTVEVWYANSPSMDQMAQGCHHIDSQYDFYVPWSTEGADDIITGEGIHALVTVSAAQIRARKQFTIRVGPHAVGKSFECGQDTYTCSREQQWSGSLIFTPT